MTARILIVEDEAITAMGLEVKLNNLGYQVAGTVDTGEKAVTTAQQDCPNLVLMDINLLGEMDGIEAASRIKNVSIPVVYLTAYSGEEFLKRAQITEPYGYLLKPVEDRTLHATIEMALFKHKMESQLAKRERWLEALMSSMGDGVLAVDHEGTINFQNKAAEVILGLKGSQIVGRPFREVYHLADPESQKGIDRAVESVLKNGSMKRLQDPCRLVRTDGEIRMTTLCIAPLKPLNGDEGGAVMTFQDITQEFLLNQKVAYLDSHDVLTGFLNRKGFERVLGEGLASARHAQSEHALIFLDLDRFRVINDTCGHHAGDDLLRRLSQALKAATKEVDVFGRLGGDEFAAFLSQTALGRAREVAGQLLQSVKDFTFEWNNKTFKLSACIGIVIIDHRSQNVAECLAAADEACYLAKEKGRNLIYVLDAKEQEVVEFRGRVQWVNNCQHALEENRFCLYSQPIVPLIARPAEGEHCEILLRMIDGSGALIPPGRFIPAAELYGIMPDLDLWVVRNALPIIKKRVEAGYGKGRMCFSINLSGSSLGSPDFFPSVMKAIQNCGFDPGNLCFEITETAAIANFSETRNFIKSLKELGCRFSLDDFGTGLSSFAYLKSLPFDFLKIDGSFVRHMDRNVADHTIVRAIAKAGKVLGIETTAEYVENREICDQLIECGVTYGQGYYFQKPAPFC